MKATDKIDRIISIHENNVGQLGVALSSAKRDSSEMSEDVKAFLLSLAKSSIVLAASHEPQKRKPRKPRTPKAEKTVEKVVKADKAPRKARAKSALAASAAAASAASGDDA